ncbi:MAG: hypothetical protein AB7U83_08725 [Vicinamibacterales bacterium]
MTRAARWWIGGGLAVLAVVAAGVALRYGPWARSGRQTPAALTAEIAALEAERDRLRERLESLVGRDPRLDGMPDAPVRLAVPTSLAADLVTRVIAGVADQVTIELRNLRVRKRGTVRKVITLGDYDLRVTVNRVVGTLRSGTPTVGFGDDEVALALPLEVAAGTGTATIEFTWDGRNISGAVCGDMTVTQEVSGAVVPHTYPVSGRLRLTATPTGILAEPQLPPMRLRLGVVPSNASWQAAQKILDDKTGLCGFVLDRVDVLGAVRRLVDRGFRVRLPVEKLRPVALPVGVEPTLQVRGEPVALGIRVGELAVTEHAIWLGAEVAVTRGELAAR